MTRKQTVPLGVWAASAMLAALAGGVLLHAVARGDWLPLSFLPVSLGVFYLTRTPARRHRRWRPG